MPTSHPLTLTSTSVQIGTPFVYGPLSIAQVSPVNVTAGQQITSATLRTDANPNSYPNSGNDQIAVSVQDETGNQFAVVVTYTGRNANGFTGCTAQNPDPTLSTLAAPAQPIYGASVSIDRTLTGGLNSLTSASSLTVDVQWSADGGTTWNDAVSSPLPGGIFQAKGGGQLNTDTLNVSGLSAVLNSARVVCTASGPSPIQAGGTATITTR